MCRRNKPSISRARAKAFTVVELLVAVSLMTLIVLALYSMFNQTQKAMLSNENQVDSSERGRGVLELVSRELESARVGMRIDAPNLWIRPHSPTNFAQNDFSVGAPASGDTVRENTFDNVYYLTKVGRAWVGVGYAVREIATNSTGREVLGPARYGMGKLYRYETPIDDRDYAFPTTNLFQTFLKTLPPVTAQTNNWPLATNFNHIAEGVVHFKLLPYDTKGQLMSYPNAATDPRYINASLDPAYRIVRSRVFGPIAYPGSNIDINNKALIASANVRLEEMPLTPDPEITVSTFLSNALPAYVELELGVLEPDAMRIYNQMMKDGQTGQASEYLKRKVAKVQIYRKRIPFRTVAQ